MELLGDDWLEYGDWGIEVESKQVKAKTGQD